MWNPFKIVRSDFGFEARERARRELEDAYFENVKDPKVPEFVLEQVKSVVEIKQQSLRAMEVKAAQLVGFSGTVIAVLGLFGHSIPAVMLVPIVCTLLVSIGFSITSMWVREDDLPSPSLYNSNLLPSDDATRARIAMALTEAYTGYSLDLQHIAAIKGRCMRAGLVVFGLALAPLPFVTLLASKAPTTQPIRVDVKCYTTPVGGARHAASGPKLGHEAAARHAAP